MLYFVSVIEYIWYGNTVNRHILKKVEYATKFEIRR